jgi:hypothetical protein
MSRQFLCYRLIAFAIASLIDVFVERVPWDDDLPSRAKVRYRSVAHTSINSHYAEPSYSCGFRH